MVLTGLDQLMGRSADHFPGRIGYLCHAASVDSRLTPGPILMEQLFGQRWTTIFSPQHGLVGNVQDNMIESDHYLHPYFKRKVYSLYSDTREPKAAWLAEVDWIFIDLQDVGCRVYTYIYTLSLMMKVAQQTGTRLVVLDRPNPARADLVEGNVLDLKFRSFVGMHPLPPRHGLTIGEFALWAKEHCYPQVKLEVIAMQNYQRSMDFAATGLPWVLPSPNLGSPDAAFTFITTVYFEGTNISEGRGCTRALECFGHPQLTESYQLIRELTQRAKDWKLEGFVFRPMVFLPTFQKHAGKDCQGAQIHVTDRERFRPWRLAQFLLQECYQRLGGLKQGFQWKQPPYEYEYELMPIDLIQGSDVPRVRLEQGMEISASWCEEFENQGMSSYQQQRREILRY